MVKGEFMSLDNILIFFFLSKNTNSAITHLFLCTQSDKINDSHYIYLDNIYSKEELDIKNSKIAGEIENIELQIDHHNKILLSTDTDFISRCLNMVSKMVVDYNELSVQDKRRFLRKFLPSFTLRKQGIKSFTLNVCAIGNHIHVAF